MAYDHAFRKCATTNSTRMKQYFCPEGTSALGPTFSIVPSGLRVFWCYESPRLKPGAICHRSLRDENRQVVVTPFLSTQ